MLAQLIRKISVLMIGIAGILFLLTPSSTQASPWTSTGPYGGSISSLISDSSNNLYAVANYHVWELVSGTSTWKPIGDNSQSY